MKNTLALSRETQVAINEALSVLSEHHKASWKECDPQNISPETGEKTDPKNFKRQILNRFLQMACAAVVNCGDHKVIEASALWTLDLRIENEDEGIPNLTGDRSQSLGPLRQVIAFSQNEFRELAQKFN